MRSRTFVPAAPVLVTVLIAIFVAGPGGCGDDGKGDVRIAVSSSPRPFKSFGKTSVYVEIEGTGGRLTDITVPFARRKARWFLPNSIRLAMWDDETGSYQVVMNSAWDADKEIMQAQIQFDGSYTIVGLSRSGQVLYAQQRICSFFETAPSDTFLGRDCERILCPPMVYDEWGDAWAGVDPTMTPDTLAMQYGNICDECFKGSLTASDFPECDIFLVAVIDVDDIVADEEMDSDRDGLLDAAELSLGTDPFDIDSDDDGLVDGWEVLGYDSNGDGNRDIDLASMGVDPNHKDILVEVDWMFEDDDGDGSEDPGEFSFKPRQAAIDYVVVAFASAPVHNRDGVDGINLIVNVSEGMPKVDLKGNLEVPGPNGETTFSATHDRIKNGYNLPVPPLRVPGRMEEGMAGISRYCIFIDSWHVSGRSGLAEFPGPSDDFVVSLGAANVRGGTLEEQTGTFMHELGHTLGLYHSGSAVPGADFDREFEIHYPSVMNYYHQWSGVSGTWHYGPGPGHQNIPGCVSAGLGCVTKFKGRMCFRPSNPCKFTYSQGFLPDVDEKDLDENNGIEAMPGQVDWNHDGVANATGVAMDLNGDDIQPQPHSDHDDWANLILKFW